MTTYVNITNSQFLSPTFVGDTSVTYLITDLYNKPTYTWISPGVWNLVAWSNNTSQNVTAPSNSSTGLTDAELRATPVPVTVSSGVGGGASDTTEATQLLVKAAVQNIDTDLGAPADAAATTDTGSFSLLALIKRSLQNWTTLLGRLPASLGVKTGAASLPVVLASDQALALPGGAATSALQTTGNTSLASVDGKLPAQVSGRVPVDGSGVTQPVVAVVRTSTGCQQLSISTTSVALSPPANSVACNIQADGNTIRITQNGAAASATLGIRVDDGVVYYVDTDLTQVRLFASVATSVIVTYFDKA